MKLENQTPFAAHALPLTGPGNQPLLVVVVKATFDMSSAPEIRLADEMQPIAFGDELVESERGMLTSWEADLAPYKPLTDVLVAGRARAPRGKPCPSLDVRLRVGPVDKTLRVFGARRWRRHGLGGDLGPSEPGLFDEQEIGYPQAFGGTDAARGAVCLENPLGVGFFAKKAKKKDVEGSPLPAVEDPRQLIRAWQDQPRPAGFGCLGRGWQPRVARLGTYDERWQKERAPEPPADFSSRFFNAAPDDQQVEGFLRGGEAVEIRHMTPEGKLAFRLPEMRPEVTALRHGRRQAGSVVMNLDTVGLQVDALRLILVWRGGCEIRSLGDSDVAEVAVGTVGAG